MNKTFLHRCRKPVAGLMAFVLTMGSLGISSAQEVPSASGALQHFNPPLLRGIKVYGNDPLKFDFILDKGDFKRSDDDLKGESNKLIKYFLASLTIPEKDLWVNLSPCEKDRIVPEAFGQTEMGRDLLLEDYMLKQITASLIYPEGERGKTFWKELYARTQQEFGTTDIPVNAFNKVWIVPEKAVVYENVKAATSYVAQARLRVMLESDYLATNKDQEQRNDGVSRTNDLAKEVLRRVVVPYLEQEVNIGANFAQLRQVYHSLILAAWYKKKVKESLLANGYVDRRKVKGVNIHDPKESEKIWGHYLEAFKKGTFNYVKEPDPLITEPRKYFSGGCNLAVDTAMDVQPVGKTVLPDSGDEPQLFQVTADAAMETATDKTSVESPRFDPIPADGVIVAVGSSSTRGVVEPKYSYPAILAQMIGHVINEGVPAERLRNSGGKDETKTDGLTRLPRVLDEHKPSLLILWHGINDLVEMGKSTHWDNEQSVEEGLKEMITAARDRHCQVLLLGTGNHLQEPGDLAVYERVARDTGTPYLKDIGNGILNNPEFMFDRMHADSIGNLMIAQRIAEFLWQRGALDAPPDVDIKVPKSDHVAIKDFWPPVTEYRQSLAPDDITYFNVGIGKPGVPPEDVMVRLKVRYWDRGWSQTTIAAQQINNWGHGWYRFKAQIPKGVDAYMIQTSYDGKPVDDGRRAADKSLEDRKRWIWSERINVQHEISRRPFEKSKPGRLILAFGSSSTAGVLQTPGFSYPDQLQQSIGQTYRVVNHGVPGERINSRSGHAPTSPGGLTRWKNILESYAPEDLKGSIAIIWHGRNDLFDNSDPVEVIGKSLKEMVLEAQRKGMQPLIIGAARRDGARDEDIYEKVAHDTGAFYLPGMMQKIWQPQFMMPDKIHTNQQGNQRIAETVAQFLRDHGALDQAMDGGIDLTPTPMNVETAGSPGDGIRFHIDVEQLKQLRSVPGLTPVIVNIQPLKNLTLFLGVEDQRAVPPVR